MSTEPEPTPAPESDPAPDPQPRLPEFKRGNQQGGAEEKSDGASWAGGIIAVLIAIGGGLFAVFEKRDEQPVQPIAMPKIDLDRVGREAAMKRAGGEEKIRQLIRSSIAQAAKVQAREEAEAIQGLLKETEKLAKTAVPDMLPEVQQAQRDLEQGLQQNRFPKFADLKPKPRLPVAPPPREVKR